MTDHYAAVLADLEAQRERIDIAIGAIKALRPNAPSAASEQGTIPFRLHLSMDDEGPAPPPPPLRPKRVIPTDPELLRLEAVRLMDAGYGMNEVKEMLELTEPQAQAFFYGH